MSEPALEVADLHAGHGGRAVLSGVRLRLAPGEWYALLGANGVGKSTLLDVVGGRLAARHGSVAIAGHCVVAEPLAARGALGYGCAPEALPGLLTPRQCFAVHATAKRLAAPGAEVLALAADLGLAPHLDAFVDTLSYGTRQKLSILLALVGAPRLVVLDEALNGLDAASGLRLKAELRRRAEAGAAVLLATHALDVVERHADRAGLLHDGRIVREWTRAELAAAGGAEGLEALLAHAARGAGPSTPPDVTADS